MADYLRRLPLYGEIASSLFVRTHRSKKPFTCPVCHYHGPFLDTTPSTGRKRHSQCPRCGSLERHRLQALVLAELSKFYDFSRLAMLHVAPEPFFRKRFQKTFRRYTSSDLNMAGVDLRADLRHLPVGNAHYDLVFASHVLEHINEDHEALAEIRRVLRPGGLAILPVPLVAPRTIEYPGPNDHEEGHVRAPGPDYYDRYREYFSSLSIYSSADFPEEFQTFSYEDRSRWPTPAMPLRPPMEGERHPQTVPVCFVDSGAGSVDERAPSPIPIPEVIRRVPHHFEIRDCCPICKSTKREMLYRCRFTESPISTFLKHFYSSQGDIEMEFLLDATFVLDECRACGVIYQRGIPNESLMRKLYEKWIDPICVFDKDDAFDRHAKYVEEIMMIIMYFKIPPKQLTFLDFGMGWGRWCRMAQAFGCSTFGIELSRIKAKYAQSQGVHDIGWKDINRYRFDFINIEQVLEHIAEPFETLLGLKNCLKSHGLIKIGVPDGGNVKRLLKAPDWTAPKGSRRSLNAVSPLEHINCFTYSSLLRTAEMAGLRPVTMPMSVQYGAMTNWRPVRRLCGNLVRPVRRLFQKRTYQFFAREGSGVDSALPDDDAIRRVAGRS